MKGRITRLSLNLDKVLVWRYLFCNRCWRHTPYSLSILNSHLLNKHLFLISRNLIPGPCSSFERQIIFHLVNRYFLFVWSLCQKKHDLWHSNLFLTALGIKKKDNKNIGKLVRTELIRTNRSLYESGSPVQQPNLRSNRSCTGFHSLFNKRSVVNRNPQICRQQSLGK
jgi:hypothetical protein